MASESGGGKSQDRQPLSRFCFDPDRHLKVVTDVFGRLWICPGDVNESRDLAKQGCWRCGDRAPAVAQRGIGEKPKPVNPTSADETAGGGETEEPK